MRTPSEIAPSLNKAGLSTTVPEQRKLAAIVAADVVGTPASWGATRAARWPAYKWF